MALRGETMRETTVPKKASFDFAIVKQAVAVVAFALFFAFSLVLIGPFRQEGAAAEIDRGPDYPAIADEYADVSDEEPASIAVTLVNQPTGQTHTVRTTIGRISLPDPTALGFTAPVPGAVFDGWSADAAGTANVYAANQIYPDNGTNSAKLRADANVYAIWLLPGDDPIVQNAYFFIRLDGKVPFEPGGNGTAAYAPSGTQTSLVGTVRQPVAIANNLQAVAADISSAPTDEAVAAVLSDAGLSYDPDTQNMLWYVVKPRNESATSWNVNGIVVDKSNHLLAYNPNGGCSNVPDARPYAPGTLVTLDARRPTRPGYSFLGWSTDPTSDTPEYAPGASDALSMPNNSLTLYAVWQPITVDVTYIAEPEQGGTVTSLANKVQALSGEGITGSTAAPSDDYVFAGWFKGDQLVQTNARLSAQDVADSADRQGGLLASTQFQARFEQKRASLSVRKAVTSDPRNGEYYQEGETIAFTVSVTNDGNVPIVDIALSDTLSALESVASLQPGETAVRNYEYVVTDDDAARGSLTNVVEAEGVVPAMNDAGVRSLPASCAVLAHAAPASSTYVLFGAYPQAGGAVERAYELVDRVSGEGLAAVNATEKDGYAFSGWYTYDGQFVSDDALLSVEAMRAVIDRNPQRSASEPVMFLAYFQPKADEPAKPDAPDTPVTPDTPVAPEPPDEPDGSGENGEPDKDEGSDDGPSSSSQGDEPGADGASGAGDVPSGKSDASNSGMAKASSGHSLVRAGDSVPGSGVFLLLIAAAALGCGGFALKNVWRRF